MHAAARNSDRSIGELIGWVIAWSVAIGIFGFPLNLSDPVQIASSLRPDMIFGRDRG
jgi:hypothetical protein